jgi:photosystem II stability/assembly factor-like uncharacterized protein
MNDRLEPEIRRAMHELADATPPAPSFDDVVNRPHAPREPGRRKLFTGVAIAASLAAAVAGLVLIASRDDRDAPTSPSTTLAAPPTLPVTTLPAPTTSPATTPVTAAVTAPSTAPVTTTTTTAAPGLDATFTPASITWISLRQGWLLGAVDCRNGNRCAALAHTADGGGTWLPATIPDGLPAASVRRVRFADAANGWIFGDDLYATHDGGATWTKVDGLTDVTSLEVSGGRAWAEAAWTEFPDAQVLYTSPAAADAWQQVGSMTVSLPIALRGDTGYVRGPDGGLFLLTPSGFEVRTDPCGSGTDMSAIAVADAQTVAVTCGSGAAGSELKQIQVSHDGGHTFSAAGEAPFPGITSAFVAPNPTTFVLAATSGASWLYRSTDGGATWTTVFEDDGGGESLVDLGFTDAAHGLVILGAQTLLTTSDGGATWRPAAIHR